MNSRVVAVVPMSDAIISRGNSLLDLVYDQNSSNNDLRRSAEVKFNQLASQNPSLVARELVQSCSAESSLPIEIKQSCLLHLKRMVPKFWSLGFELFTGPPIDQNTKSLIRESLLQLSTLSPHSKIRSGSSYVIVQIAAADFPDEWPDLLDILYTRAIENQSFISVIGVLSLLNDLFDDLITEEQFWEGGVGNKLISYIVHVMKQSQMAPEIKVGALKLYLSVFNTLLSVEAHGLDVRKSSVIEHIQVLSDVILSLLRQLLGEAQQKASVELAQLSLRSHIYQVYSKALISFKRYIPQNEAYAYAQSLCDDFWFTSNVYKKCNIEGSASIPVSMNENFDEPENCFANHLITIFETFTVVQESCCISDILNPEQLETFSNTLLVCSQYPKTTVDAYTSDFNCFVTDASGLSSRVTVRDSINDFLGDLNAKDAISISSIVYSHSAHTSCTWNEMEAMLFVSECLLSNEDSIFHGKTFPIASYMAYLLSQLSSENIARSHSLLTARVVLLIPKVLENIYPVTLHESPGLKDLQCIIEVALRPFEESGELVLASILMSVALWKNIEKLNLRDLGSHVQARIFNICDSILNDSDEDTLPVILESISAAISMAPGMSHYTNGAKSSSVIELILQVSFVDPANVQVSISSAECLQELLNGMDLERYSEISQKLVPFLVNTISEEQSEHANNYSPRLHLSLDLLSYILEASPYDELPENMFFCIMPALKDLISITSDDQILQSAGELFSKLMYKNENLFVKYTDPQTNQSGLEILLSIASHFLSPKLSDSAAMNCGSIVMTLFERFQSHLGSQFYFELLEATVKRISVAKEVTTIENFITVFCRLVLETSPLIIVDALARMKLADNSGVIKDGLNTVLPIWFDSFEVIRGAEKIQQNILALGKIFALGDPRVEGLQVNGDLIPYEGDLIITRSMARTMPQKFTQVSAPLKIIKLLVNELKFQSLQPNAKDYVIENIDEGADEESWEDLEAIGVADYEKLRSYVDSDNESLEETTSQDVRVTLIQFFKECIAKNLSGFQTYYEALHDDERAVLCENVIFA